ncbi:MAG: terminase family protein [Pseudomonadota bacterium]
MSALLLPHAFDLAEAELAELARQMEVADLREWLRDWSEWAHDGQRAPAGDWRTWVMMAGRGFGKTRAGAEWVLGVVRGAGAPVHIALVAATVAEARRVMVEGPSGLLAVGRQAGAAVRFEPSLGRVSFAGGSVATLFSGANPEALRGPQHGFAWCDELAKWRHPVASWDMLQLGLRVGARPRALVTTTPRAGSAALAAILAGGKVAVTGGATGLNPHLPDAYLDAVTAAYGGTALGRQEVEGVFDTAVAGSLWPADLIEACRGERPAAERLRRVVIGVDPPASAGGTCGIVACGVDGDGVAHVLGDHSAGGLSPEGWAAKVAGAAAAHGADRVIAEKNQGGDMVMSVLKAAGRTLPVRLVTASRGKMARAEPVAALFESGQARLAGSFAELEAELAGMVPGSGYAGPGISPDRADAMVWALWALMLEGKAEPRVREI